MTTPELVTYQMVLLRHTVAGRDFDEQGLYCFDVMTWPTAPGTVTPPPATWARG